MELRAAHLDLRDRLVAAGRLVPTGVDGVYGRDADFERVVDAVSGAVSALGAGEGPTRIDFPPLIPRTTFEAIGYLRSFPQLSGVVHSFAGDDRSHAELIRRLDEGEPYASVLAPTDVTMTPACCYPLYPTLPDSIGGDGAALETCGYCFRHEPSVDPMRLQAFRQHEHVRVGTADQVEAWRELWLRRAPELLGDLGLEHHSEYGNDAFFGRGGRLMSMSQRELELKTEFLVPVFGAEHATACASVNYHQDRFGQLFGVRTPDGAAAHSACVGFGLERCAIALFAAHGIEVAAWPVAVRTRLWGA